MKIINRYVIKEHVGPFVFALSALTSLLLLQYVARQFGNLVGKGLGWQVILEFFLLSIPFTVAMTLPMAVLVAVLYAYSRLASENEITALKAGGISSRALMIPALIASVFVAACLLFFNDQILPRANHRLAVLQIAILQTKPTFALREQVLNTVKEGQLYLRAAHIDEASQHMRDVVIYDLSDAARRRTVYADSGILALAPNRRDITMRLFKGIMLSVPTTQRGTLNRMAYNEDLLKVRDVASQFEQNSADNTSKGDREMSVCEMQRELDRAYTDFRRAEVDRALARWGMLPPARRGPQPKSFTGELHGGGLGALYCSMLGRLSRISFVKKLAAAELPPQGAPIRPGGPPRRSTPDTSPAPRQPKFNPAVGDTTPTNGLGNGVGAQEAEFRVDDARRRMNAMGVEIQKKFSLAAACVVFVLVGAPIALRFPRGGVGLVIGVSFFVFAFYYVCLIGGESLARNNYLSPFWAMWGANVIFLLAGLGLMTRMGREGATARGGSIGEVADATRRWFARQVRRINNRAARAGGG